MRPTQSIVRSKSILLMPLEERHRDISPALLREPRGPLRGLSIGVGQALNEEALICLNRIGREERPVLRKICTDRPVEKRLRLHLDWVEREAEENGQRKVCDEPRQRTDANGPKGKSSKPSHGWILSDGFRITQRGDRWAIAALPVRRDVEAPLSVEASCTDFGEFARRERAWTGLRYGATGVLHDADVIVDGTSSSTEVCDRAARARAISGRG